MASPDPADKDFICFMSYALSEYMSNHIVFVSPRMQSIFGEVIEI